MKLLKIIYILIVPLLVTACSTQKIASPSIKRHIDAVLTRPELVGAQSAIMIRDANNGEIIYQHHANDRLVPASSMKLLTSAAAFDILGTDYRFYTATFTDGYQRNDELVGNLYLRGTGDPTMLVEDYQTLAKVIAAKGIKRVRGDVIMDDTWFDDIRLGKDWAQDDEEYPYTAQISALTVSPDNDYNAGSVNIKLAAGDKIGQPITISMHPANHYLTLVNQAVTGADDTLSVEREHGTNRIIIGGHLPAGETKNVTRSVWEPTQWVAHLFIPALQQHGVTLQGKTQLGVATPEDAQLLSSHTSIPLSELNVPFLKLSNNTHAEILIKAMGRKAFNSGTSNAGISAVADFLRRNGMDTSSMLQSDGSGLSRRNLVTPTLFTDLLIAARQQPWFDTWYTALPVAGDANPLTGGTLRNRMRGTAAAGNVVAKTGTLGGVSSLMGYVTMVPQRKVVFSIVINNALVSVKEIEDSIALVLAEPLKPMIMQTPTKRQ